MEDVMKITVWLLSIFLLGLTGVNAELINANPDPNGDPWYVGGVIWDETEIEWYNSLPEFNPTSESNSTDLPDYVNNAKNPALPYFRSIFWQYGNSCAQASTIGYAFTYEINRLKGQSVIDIESYDHEKYRFPTHFTYNFHNKGSGQNGTYISNAVTTSTEFGVPNCSIWRDVTRESSDQFADPPRWEDPMSGNDIQWMIGYDRYCSAMQNRTVSTEKFSNLIDPGQLLKLKQYLNDHGADDDAEGGGVAVFTMNFSTLNMEYIL